MRIKKNHKEMTGAHASSIFGIAGSSPGVGVTHFSILFANYMTSALGKKTALLEWNASGDFARLEEVLCKKSIYKVASMAFKILGVSYIKRAGEDELLECINCGFDVIIIDFGNNFEVIRKEFLRCGKKILLGSFSEWQMGAFTDLIAEKESSIGKWDFLAVFGSEKVAVEVKRTLRVSIGWIPHSGDAFAVTAEIMAFFEDFLRY